LIAVDTNILVYAHREESPFHAAALRCVTELAESDAPWAIPWPCLHEFLAVVTHPRVYAPPTQPAAAFARIVALCRHHGVRELWSADRDFGRFVEVAVVKPLAR
jgi:predicted nucleic acid-binding protein